MVRTSMLRLRMRHLFLNPFYCKKNYHFIIISIVLILLWIIVNRPIVNVSRLFNFGLSSDLSDSSSIVVTKAKLSSFDLKRSNINFDNFVLEKENVGEEDIEKDYGRPIGIDTKRKSVNAIDNKFENDVNAAVEAISNEHGKLPVFSDKKNLNKLSSLSSGKIYNSQESEKVIANVQFHVWNKSYLEKNGAWNYRQLNEIEINNLSVLGRRLFLHEDVGQISNKTFLINIYKYGRYLENRLIKQYGSKNTDPFEHCSVKNCNLSYADEDFHKADSVLFHLHRMEVAPSNKLRRNYLQRWVWLSDESPYNTFTLAKDKNMDHYNGIFNWSMTYRSTSDVPVPYGRTIPVFDNYNFQYKDIFNRKNKTVAIMGSNCSGRNKRWDYIKKFMQFINVDAYGRCGELKCPGHFNKDCDLLRSYKFYLAFENANCMEYITEKAWWNAFAKYSVPIVMGTSKEDYMKLFPPGSFIYAEDFRTPKDLAEYVQYLASNEDAYSKYHEWRKTFAVVNEHGYFRSNAFHYCRLCEALNYNSHELKTYPSLKRYWNTSRDCYPAKWFKKLDN